MRALGPTRKPRLGRTAVPLLLILRSFRRLRGTRVDRFGRPKVRRVGRARIGEYVALVACALLYLDVAASPMLRRVGTIPDPGGEEVNAGTVDLIRLSSDQFMAQIAPAASSPVEPPPVRRQA
jgi:indolepyruvate ferredoxin oxidoreductase